MKLWEVSNILLIYFGIIKLKKIKSKGIMLCGNKISKELNNFEITLTDCLNI
jgi:hypothetical protein